MAQICILYGILLLAFLFLFIWKIMNRWDKKLEGNTILLMTVLWFLAAFAGWLSVLLFKDQPQNLGCLNRLMLFCLGGLATWLLYRLEWVRRDIFDKEQDSFENEFIYIGLVSCGMVFFMIGFPIAGGSVEKEQMNQWLPNAVFWDAGLCALLPFLMTKMVDSLSQMPYPIVYPWIYPMMDVVDEWNESIDTQVRFEIAASGSIETNPHLIKGRVEVPSTQKLGDIFCIFVQQHRKNNKKFPTLETEGLLVSKETSAPYWLSFQLKRSKYHPTTWFSLPRYLNPADALKSLQLRSTDIIYVERVPYNIND